jgi:hypothetical protein
MKLAAAAYFFSNIWLSGTRAAGAGSSTATFYMSIDVAWPKDVPFGCFIIMSTPMGSNSPKLPSFGA